MASRTMRARVWWAGAMLALGLAASPAWAVDARGVITTTDDRTIDGVIRWKGVAKVYIVARNDNIELEVPPSKVKAIRVAKPAGFDEAVKAVQENRLQEAIPVLDKLAQDYVMLQWDGPAA